MFLLMELVHTINEVMLPKKITVEFIQVSQYNYQFIEYTRGGRTCYTIPDGFKKQNPDFRNSTRQKPGFFSNNKNISKE